MFSDIICRAVTDLSSKNSGLNAGKPIAPAQAVKNAISQFCASQGIAPLTDGRTMQDLGRDIGTRFKELCSLQTESGLRLAQSLLDSVGQLSYQIFRDVVAEQIGPRGREQGGWGEEPFRVGTASFKIYYDGAKRALYDLDAGHLAGPIGGAPISPSHFAECRGNMYGAFSVPGAAGNEFILYNLRSGTELIRIPNDPTCTSNMVANSQGAYIGVSDYAKGLYVVYKLSEDHLEEVYKLGFDPNHRVDHDIGDYRFNELHVFNDQVYQTIELPTGWLSVNLSNGKVRSFDCSADHFSSPVLCGSGIYQAVYEEEGWATYNLSTGELVRRFPHNSGGPPVEFKGSLFQSFGDASEQVVFNVITGQQLFLTDGTKVLAIDKVGDHLYLTAQREDKLAVYDYESGRQVGLESDLGELWLTSITDCNGRAYQIATVGGEQITYDLFSGRECIRTAKSSDLKYPIAANGRVFLTEDTGYDPRHFDLATGARVLHGAQSLYLLGDNTIIFEDAESKLLYRAPLNLVF